jgi:hypothetical protein
MQQRSSNLLLGRITWIMDIQQNVRINAVHAMLPESDEGHRLEEDFVACVRPALSKGVVALQALSLLAEKLRDLEQSIPPLNLQGHCKAPEGQRHLLDR